MSGKTTLAKKIAANFKANNIACFVLDPLLDPSWGADFITDNPDYFMKIVGESRECALFIDESGESIGRNGGEMNKLATRYRHFGHRAHFIAQRAQQLDKIVRDNCETVYLFRSSKGDCKLLAEEYGHEELETGYALEKGEFFMAARFEKLIRTRVF